MLNCWLTDEQRWPTDRTPEMFREWFDVQMHPTVGEIRPNLHDVFNYASKYQCEEASRYCAPPCQRFVPSVLRPETCFHPHHH